MLKDKIACEEILYVYHTSMGNQAEIRGKIISEEITLNEFVFSSP
jgi:hypothetical protein